MDGFTRELSRARHLPAADLPQLFRELMQAFPELREAPEVLSPFGRPRVRPRGCGGEAAGAEARAALGAVGPTAPETLRQEVFKPQLPELEAVRLARALRPRFQVQRGALAVVAPGRLERREAARGQGLPFRLDLPGGEGPRPQVAICVDTSGSMWDVGFAKIFQARLAAQAIALAVREVGGDVVGLLFDDHGYVATPRDASPLFTRLDGYHHRRGTSFAFLADLWRCYPRHWVVLVTDGAGLVPFAAEPDRRRTVAAVIPDGAPDQLQPICARVVELATPRDLPWVMAMLIPRTSVG